MFLLDGRYHRRREQAVAICANCPVAVECLDWALAWDSDPCPRHILAGLEPWQRHELREQLRASGVPPTHHLGWGLE